MSGLKASEVKVLKKVTQILGEKDESIRQAFSTFDTKVGKSFGVMEIKHAVFVRALTELGMPETRLQEILNEIQQQMKQAQTAPENGGGDNNGQQPYGEDLAGGSREPAEEPEAGISEELGAEHFGRD